MLALGPPAFVPPLVPLASGSAAMLLVLTAQSVAILGLLVFAAFLLGLAGLAWAAYRAIRNSHPAGQGGGSSGCLLGCGFGALLGVLAVLGLVGACALALVIGIARHWPEPRARRAPIERSYPQEPARDERAPAQSEPATGDAPEQRPLDEELRETERALRDAQREAESAAEDARRTLGEALREAGEATREAARATGEALEEARRTLQDTLRERGEARRAAPGDGLVIRDPARPIHLRFEVEGSVGDALSKLVEEVSGEHPALTTLHISVSGEPPRVQHDYAIAQPRDLARLEDELRARLAALELPEGCKVSFKDVLVQH